MPETAESHSITLTTNRNCTIEITNVSSVYCLINPKVYMKSGFTYNPPQPTVRTTKSEVCSFTKDDNTASGAVGVLTYELFDMRNRHCNELMAVMFSVPFDYNFYKNWLGVGVFEHTKACDKKLFELMYEGKDFTNFVRHEADGSGVKYAARTVDVRACMSDEGRAMIKLEVYDKMGR
ncbi:DELTA-sagatoxin-Srs1a-like [Seriola dumerili]|uniref:DELTA-sagatoxin-Srs1a-like n=1 Tax=Seriola dumerili TaxID=41447 RepID=A0A3B4TNL5_SERDU|nr:DELTA-sagatoxin-Srs1a-like [Seriola dumerili]XP_022598592.1 DELTA-sagatoxin-Srs1a-like [Seriola dumerili]